MVCNANVNLHRQSLAKSLLMGIAGLLTIPLSLASEASEPPETAPQATVPGCSSAGFRAFDFWLGDWQVRLADGTLAGENRIEASADGCYLTERWRGARGSTGYSINFFEPGSDRWRQLWVSAGAIIEISGGLEGGSMVLTGEIRYQQQPPGPDGFTPPGAGPVRPFRGRWTPLTDGRVRQYFEELISDNSNGAPGNEKWQPWFEGFYSKAVE